jgi:hypothetical protein
MKVYIQEMLEKFTVDPRKILQKTMVSTKGRFMGYFGLTKCDQLVHILENIRYSTQQSVSFSPRVSSRYIRHWGIIKTIMVNP